VRTLVIETATSVCSVALLENGAVVAAAHENVGRGHAERLLPMIAALPDGGRAASILVDCGPGSFTGIRVGVAAARGLAFGWDVPVSGFSSLALLAAGYLAGSSDAPVTVAINAGHSEIFIQSFTGGPVRSINELASLARAAAAEISERIVVGNAADDLIATRGEGQAVDRALDARDAILLTAELSSLPPTPIYGRGADAKPMAERVAQA
jgi:tRNA threonylcarbamoyladenosine biosynthesis protein TsaB